MECVVTLVTVTFCGEAVGSGKKKIPILLIVQKQKLLH